MSFVSYAQNFEDVILWRALKHVENGFYVDIGAQDPIVDSVSFGFYKLGWRGVHVEPTNQYSAKLKKARPDEIVERKAIGKAKGSIWIYEFENTGLSTAVPEIAEKHKADGFIAIETEVPVSTMDALLNQYRDKVIHWLKIDVEGFEKQVIESWCNSTVRPWILIIESTKPLSHERNHFEWEALIIDKGYHFAYFDGLNRFYVHQNNLELLSFFEAPPNVFDDFSLSGTASQPFYASLGEQIDQIKTQLEKNEIKAKEFSDKARIAEVRAEQAEFKLQAANDQIQVMKSKALQFEGKLQDTEAKLRDANLRAIQAESRLNGIFNSRLWRITAPWRWTGNLMRRIKHGAVVGLALSQGSGSRQFIKRIIVSAMSNLSRHPDLRNAFSIALKPFPKLLSRLRVINELQSYSFPPLQNAMEREIEGIENLAPRAQFIYFQLKAALEKNKKDNH